MILNNTRKLSFRYWLGTFFRRAFPLEVYSFGICLRIIRCITMACFHMMCLFGIGDFNFIPLRFDCGCKKICVPCHRVIFFISFIYAGDNCFECNSSSNPSDSLIKSFHGIYNRINDRDWYQLQNTFEKLMSIYEIFYLLS